MSESRHKEQAPSKKRIDYGNGKVFRGETVNGVPNGKGKLTYHGKHLLENEFTGEFVDEKREGYGVMIYRDGHVYEGEWRNDKREGNGDLFWVSKEQDIKRVVYKGTWKEDHMHGRGQYYSADGKSYEGSWEHGNLMGKVRVFNADKMLEFKGEY